ncbi:MAG: hypothetical protein JWM10_1417 [Myxococcaceae bacterium]|nr:hypothetical protein [Myxococcaceae bacterium]
MYLDLRTSFALVALSLLLLAAGPIAGLVDRLVARLGGRLDPATAGAAATPYRTKESAPVDASREENRRLRLALATTRLVALGPLLVVAASAWLGARSAAAPVSVPVVREHRRAGAGLPFDPRQNRVAALGPLDYTAGADGFQVPIEFTFRAPGREGIEATLILDVRARSIPGQTPMTEGIWVDGVLSGTTWPGFRVPDVTTEDVSGRNDAFTRAVFACCTETSGQVTLSLADLLRGSMVTPASVLADGVLQVVVADDVEVYGAGLSLCPRDRLPPTVPCDYVHAHTVTLVGPATARP